MDEGDTAWHCGRSDGKYKHPACRNANSIGIEMCCHQDAKGGWYIDEATMAAAAELRAGDHGPVWDSPGERAAALRCHREALPPASHRRDKWAKLKARLEDTMTQEQFNAMMDVYLAQSREKPVSDWAKNTWDKAMAAGVFDGTAPQNPLTREQAALVPGPAGGAGGEVST